MQIGVGNRTGLIALFVGLLLLAGLPAAQAHHDDPISGEEPIPGSVDSNGVELEAVVYDMIFPHLGGETTGYTDTFGACRGTNCSRSHEGIDIMEACLGDLAG